MTDRQRMPAERPLFTHHVELSVEEGVVKQFLFSVCETRSPASRCECGQFEIEWGDPA